MDRIIVPIGSISEAVVEGLHQFLETEEAHVAVGAGAVLFVPIDEVAWRGEVMGTGFEVLAVVDEGSGGIGDHHVGVVEIFAFDEPR